MQAVTSCDAHCDAEKRDLQGLLEVFGSAFSLEDIASAYCQARRKVYMASEILCASHESTSNSATCVSKDKLECASSTSLEVSSDLGTGDAMPSEMSSDNIRQKSHNGGRTTRALKSKVCPASIGTVSGVIAKDYVTLRPVTKGYPEATKPPKLDSKELSISEIRSEEVPPSMRARKGTTCDNIEEFMIKMLGDGFQLDENVIQEVLGFCGYDVQKSMEKLLDLSASTLEKCDDVVELAGKKSSEKCQDLDSSCRVTKKDKDRLALQKEVLEALFTVPERCEEVPKRIVPVRRSRAFGKPVVETFTDTATMHKIATVQPIEVTRDDEDDENSYEVLRKAVKEYWITMKEYYQAAVDAFVKGDYTRANKLLEQGHFFNRKAREADEKSSEKLLETSGDDLVSLDLHDHEPKDALSLLRLHLTSFSGIPAFKYLKVIVGTSDEDTKKGARKRLILKQLEKESIKWTEEGDGRTIMIRVDVINPKRLSFSKK
ncbi:putative nuclear RNA export factor SDE5 [Fagus crenata]